MKIGCTELYGRLALIPRPLHRQHCCVAFWFLASFLQSIHYRNNTVESSCQQWAPNRRLLASGHCWLAPNRRQFAPRRRWWLHNCGRGQGTWTAKRVLILLCTCASLLGFSHRRFCVIRVFEKPSIVFAFLTAFRQICTSPSARPLPSTGPPVLHRPPHEPCTSASPLRIPVRTQRRLVIRMAPTTSAIWWASISTAPAKIYTSWRIPWTRSLGTSRCRRKWRLTAWPPSLSLWMSVRWGRQPRSFGDIPLSKFLRGQVQCVCWCQQGHMPLLSQVQACGCLYSAVDERMFRFSLIPAPLLSRKRGESPLGMSSWSAATGTGGQGFIGTADNHSTASEPERLLTRLFASRTGLT